MNKAEMDKVIRMKEGKLNVYIFCKVGVLLGITEYRPFSET
jgi:hypothetical protein